MNHSTVADLAKMVGVTPRTIERWWKEKVIPEPAVRNEKGWKLWSPEQNRQIIRIAQERRKDGRAHRTLKNKEGV